MDYLDPKKQHHHTIILIAGYICTTIAILIATVILVYQAYGFGIDRNGAVIQNGIVFVSSNPNPAQIYLDGKLLNPKTNTRLTLPSAIYDMRLSRSGYYDWNRTITVAGGSVSHFDYPLFVPKTVTTTPVASLASLPTVASQSPDHRWLILHQSAAVDSFNVYDLKNPKKAAIPISLPAETATRGTTEAWRAVEWASDNQHLLLAHTHDASVEYIVLDRQNPDQSVNVTKLLGETTSTVSLRDKKYDRYYLYDAAAQSLQTASLNDPTPVTFLTDILAFKTYLNDTVLYVTSAGSPAGKVQLQMRVGDTTTNLRSFPTSATYIVDLATYEGIPYVIASAADEGKVYIYKDPLTQLSAKQTPVIVPLQVLKVDHPEYVSFSNTAQYVLAEHGDQVAVYDLLNKNGYNYKLSAKAALDAGQEHVNWIDGDHLTYVSKGTLNVLDYDQANQHAFVAQSANVGSFFTPDYKAVMTLVPVTNGAVLSSTTLLAPADR